MPFQDYIQMQMDCIERLGKAHHINKDDAAELWVHSGLAEIFAKTFGPILQDRAVQR